MLTSLQIGLVAVLLLGQSPGQEPPLPATAAQQDNAIERVAIIGASASAGFGVVVEQAEPGDEQYAKRMMNMQDLFVAADDPTDLVYLDLSSYLFFSRPRSFARSAVDRLLTWQPDVIFGVDFLFWFVFGVMPEEQRLEFLEVGLGMLDELASQGTPMVIGEVPNLEGTESFVISSRQIPTGKTVAKANKRINEWAMQRENVAVVPLQALTDQLTAGEQIVVGPYQWKPREDGIAMIAVDKLHPTFDGMICLAQAVEVAARSIESIRQNPATLPPMELDRDALVARMRVRRLKPRRPGRQYFSSNPRMRF